MSRLDDDRSLVWQVFAVSRLLLLTTLAGVVFVAGRPLAVALSGWDVQHFEAIARAGYADPQNVAFFPALPAILRAGAQVGIPMALTGVILSTIGAALAAWALFRLEGAVAASLWLVAPMAVFTLVPYTEAPFAAAAFWAWERARVGRWTHAAVLAAIACTFRVSGVFLIVALGVLALTQKGRSWPRLGLLLLPVAVIAAYAAWLKHATGSWLAWFHAQQQGWGRGGLHSPIDSFRLTWKAAHWGYWPTGQELDSLIFAAEIVCMAAGILTTLWLLARREWADAVWVGLQVGVFLTSAWWMSSSRAVLLWFPLFGAVARLVQWRPRSRLPGVVWLGIVSVAIAATLVALVGWAWLFYVGKWAG